MIIVMIISLSLVILVLFLVELFTKSRAIYSEIKSMSESYDTKGSQNGQKRKWWK
jgi:hypothetical protein